jgi:hypothetical protein
MRSHPGGFETETTDVPLRGVWHDAPQQELATVTVTVIVGAPLWAKAQMLPPPGCRGPRTGPGDTARMAGSRRPVGVYGAGKSDAEGVPLAPAAVCRKSSSRLASQSDAISPITGRSARRCKRDLSRHRWRCGRRSAPGVHVRPTSAFTPVRSTSSRGRAGAVRAERRRDAVNSRASFGRTVTGAVNCWTNGRCPARAPNGRPRWRLRPWVPSP